MNKQYRNGYSMGYKGYPLSKGKHSKDYLAGYKAGHAKGGKRKKRLR